MNDRYFGEEDIGLPWDLVRSDDECDMSPEESPCVIAAGVNFVVSPAVAVRVVIYITAHSGITVVVKVAAGTDQRRSIVPVGIIRCVLVHRIVAMIFSVTGDHGTLDGLVRGVVLLKLDSSVEHGNRSAAKVGSHQYTRGNVMSLLFISVHVIIVHPVVKENVVYVVHTADPPLLGEFAKSISIHKHFLVLSTTYVSEARFLQQSLSHWSRPF